ncbi:MAG: hypothetical protein FD135_4937 [Comamonadaceae bacterium]|nr:MAG: hypothetical protein FD135_4937 [Comamonadaceae bacterium]
MLTRLDLDQIRVLLKRRVRRQHVIEGGDDANVGRFLGHHTQLVIDWQGGKRMRYIGATQTLRPRWALEGRLQLCQIGRAGRATALTNALGDVVNGVVEFHVLKFNW